MRTINFKSYKIASFLPLERIAAFLKTQIQFSWNEYIMLSGDHLNMILKYHTDGKYAYLFNYGCISFVNFDDNEVYTFIRYIESIGAKVNSGLIYKFRESHIINVDDNLACKLWRKNDKEYKYSECINHIVSVVLAKSTELYMFETELDRLLDNAEKFILFLQKGRLRFYRKKSSIIVSKILRFEYESIHSVRILERPGFVERSLESKEIYDALSHHYQLDDRFTILQGKINDLREILRLYSSLSHKQSQSRLYLFEIFLLSLFPAFHIISHFLHAP